MLFDIISIICIFAIICLCAVLIESRRENHMLSVSHYTITDKRIKKSATFAMIADLHNAEFGDKNEDLIKEIKKIAPDAVLIAGDVIVGKKDVRPGVAIDLLQKLGSEFPVYISDTFIVRKCQINLTFIRTFFLFKSFLYDEF